jgi:hypothetical protein
MTLSSRLRRGIGQVYRSKGERRQLSDYYKASFTIDLEAAASLVLEKAG